MPSHAVFLTDREAAELGHSVHHVDVEADEFLLVSTISMGGNVASVAMTIFDASFLAQAARREGPRPAKSRSGSF